MSKSAPWFWLLWWCWILWRQALLSFYDLSSDPEERTL